MYCPLTICQELCQVLYMGLPIENITIRKGISKCLDDLYYPHDVELYLLCMYL